VKKLEDSTGEKKKRGTSKTNGKGGAQAYEIGKKMQKTG